MYLITCGLRLIVSAEISRHFSFSQRGAIKRAVEECITEGILEDVLLKHRAEVEDMFLTTFDKKMYEEAIKIDAKTIGLREGREEGREETQREIIRKMLQKGYASSEIAELLGVEEEFVKGMICNTEK